MAKEKSTMLLRGIDKALKDDYKAYCARRGSNMTADIIAHMKQVTRRERLALEGVIADGNH
jgi:FixJ family two-component response regulator